MNLESRPAIDKDQLFGAPAGTGVPTGAATFCFVQAVEKYGPHVTYGQLLTHMDAILNPGGSSSASSLLGGFGKLGGLAKLGGGALGKVLHFYLFVLVLIHDGNGTGCKKMSSNNAVAQFTTASFMYKMVSILQYLAKQCDTASALVRS